MAAQGWLPRSGLLYGVDYVVYQMHPTAVHSEFGVMLVPLVGPHRPHLGWMDVQITNRLINQVWKVWCGNSGVGILVWKFSCGNSGVDSLVKGRGSTFTCLHTSQVSKRLILLYLHEKPGCPGGHETPECLNYFTVRVTLHSSGVEFPLAIPLMIVSCPCLML